MRAVLQRVETASVSTEAGTIASIGVGLLALIGIEADDSQQDAEYLVQKVLNLRIFPDEDGVMNRSLTEVTGDLLIVSQFTLLGDTRKGRRPSYNRAATPELAREKYQYLRELFTHSYQRCSFGEFQAMMKVTLVNDGPVTLIVDSRKQF